MPRESTFVTPQQRIAPEERRAHDCCAFAMTATAPEIWATLTAVERKGSLEESIPSWLRELSPQHFTVASFISAQACVLPTARCWTPLSRPSADAGAA